MDEKAVSKLYRAIIEDIGEDPERDGLVKTPKRAAKAMSFLTSGYRADVDDIINNAFFDSPAEEMVLVKDIELFSLCEHHLLPFIGRCHVAYLPSGKVLGLSKVARLVDVFARRLQVQENLTNEIAACLMEKVEARGVAVFIEARHLCMMMRGVEKQHSLMRTSAMLGDFKKDLALRNEFYQMINLP